MDGGEEVSCGLVVAGGDAAELLELGEEVFDQVPCFVEVAIVIPAHLAVGFWGDHDGFAGCSQRDDYPCVGIESLVGDQRIGLHRRQQMIGASQIGCLAAGQEEAQRIAQGIDQGVDLGAQPSPRAADGLVLADFFLAPALC